MSIINDALKKTQQNLSSLGTPAANSTPENAGENKPQLGDARFSRPQGSAASGNPLAGFSPNPLPPQPAPAPHANKPTAPAPNKQHETTSPQKNKTFLLVLVLLVLAGYYLYQSGIIKKDTVTNQVQSLFKKTSEVPMVKKILPASSATRTSKTSAAKTKASAAKGQNELVLNGVMDLGEKVVALINNTIYENGDTVQGLKILEIGPNFVRLETGTILKIDGQQ